MSIEQHQTGKEWFCEQRLAACVQEIHRENLCSREITRALFSALERHLRDSGCLIDLNDFERSLEGIRYEWYL